MNKTVKSVIALIVAISANSAMAESEKWYVGGSAGVSSYGDWSSANITEFREGFGSSLGVVNFTGTQSADADDSSTGYKLFGGYSFHENISVELSYIDMGEVDADSNSSGTYSDAMNNSLNGSMFANAKAEVDAFTLDAKLNYPIASSTELVAKVGMYYADTTLNFDASSTLSAEVYDYSKSENSSGLHYGIGINFELTEVIALRAEWEQLDNVEANGGETDVDLLSVSLTYKL